MNQQEINATNSTKFLRDLYDENLKWNNHIHLIRKNS